jgi:hypothetical protein
MGAFPRSIFFNQRQGYSKPKDWSVTFCVLKRRISKCMVSISFAVNELSSITISSNVAIRYQLAKATSHWTMLFFGYFYRPLAIIGWMTVVIVAWGVAYSVVFSKSLIEAVFFSVYTFFTIGYGTCGPDRTTMYLCKSALDRGLRRS